ncbi:Lrp/AsnC ligand binding domain-containing protein [Streptomyces sp. NPDC048434]|uniref:Lrp/AsnC ligand binding domain-containing protein n=1 Tax=Streptomyces sp. NPDC048434 TaxID=3365549 RepID=UPI003711B993
MTAEVLDVFVVSGSNDFQVLVAVQDAQHLEDFVLAHIAQNPSVADLHAWPPLRDTTATVATVAKNVGYQDPFAFSVALKRCRNSTPSSWRRTSQAANATA